MKKTVTCLIAATFVVTITAIQTQKNSQLAPEDGQQAAATENIVPTPVAMDDIIKDAVPKIAVTDDTQQAAPKNMAAMIDDAIATAAMQKVLNNSKSSLAWTIDRTKGAEAVSTVVTNKHTTTAVLGGPTLQC